VCLSEQTARPDKSVRAGFACERDLKDGGGVASTYERSELVTRDQTSIGTQNPKRA